jgi:hypothetical protein
VCGELLVCSVGTATIWGSVLGCGEASSRTAIVDGPMPVSTYWCIEMKLIFCHYRNVPAMAVFSEMRFSRRLFQLLWRFERRLHGNNCTLISYLAVHIMKTGALVLYGGVRTASVVPRIIRNTLIHRVVKHRVCECSSMCIEKRTFAMFMMCV